MASDYVLSLEWAENTLKRQPDDLRLEYQQASEAVTAVLVQTVYSITLQLPHRILHDTMQTVQTSLLRLRVGGARYRLLHRSCQTAVIDRLTALARHPQPVVAEIARLVCYLAAQNLLLALPGPDDLRDRYTAFGPQGVLQVDRAAADAYLIDLARSLEHLTLAEQLYPGWTAHALYNDAAAALTTHLIKQGRALAAYYTRQMVDDIHQAWQAGKLTRGLTLLIPYFDDRRYHMEAYRVVVVPTGRILFRPEFVVGACRLAQREVRKDPALSQATRWQLLSQLDSLIQSFEIAPS